MNFYVFSIAYMAIFGYFGHLAKISRPTNIALMILAGIVVNIPIKNLSINILTYSFVGEMSVFLFTLSLVIIFENLKTHRINLLNLKAFIFIFFFGLIVYLSVLNLIPLNIYYQNPYFIIIICCLICILGYFIHKILGIIYLICLLSYGLQIMDSKNLFDYFIDAPTWILSIICILILSLKRFKKNESNSHTA
ncbi:hypothetical protein [Helicobacter sp. 11S03491-1]|uniref:hypothetical protein n=1 Tax=Helicobacter sp. 11S03491-1 TaxID=1476196 RepID=UPI000BA762E1|nr:hypothetical protein [Helicobacter sp. 11S03491-1]PAF43750.1 hypothetical protein BKH45_00330 [Helicobacter sp. 11S03491-1]